METKPIVKTWKPTVAGIFEIIDGAFSVMVSLFFLVGAIIVGTGATWAGFNEADFAPMTIGAVAAILVIIAVVVLALAILELSAGISALQRKRWGLALAGAIAAAIPGNVLGILSIIFLAMGKDEFV